MHSPYPIFWLTGNTDAGKTSLAFGALQFLNSKLDCNSNLARRAVVLDGDDMRDTISQEKSLTPEDRKAHNLRVARLACLLRQQGHLVIVSVIAPFAEVRKEISDLCEPRWIYAHRNEVLQADRPYEKPEHPDLEIDNKVLSVPEAVQKFLAYIFEACGESMPADC